MSYVSGFNAYAVGGGYVDAGTAWVTAEGEATLQQGHYIPDTKSGSCGNVNSCTWSAYWPVNCDEDDFTIETNSSANATWVFSHAGPVSTAHSWFCTWPGSPGGAGGGSTYPSASCEYYIVEESNDGGETWHQIAAFSSC